MSKNLFSENDKKMITPEGDIYRYIGSDKIDAFDVGDCADISFPNGYNKGCRVYKGISPSITVTTVDRFIVKMEEITKMDKKIRIRKLTPTECFKLMGFTAEDCEKAHYYTEEEVIKLNLRSRKKGKDLSESEKIERISNAQLYKQAGNSIVVNVLEEIFKSLGENYAEFQSNV